MNAYLFANLPRWANAILLALLFGVLPCIASNLGPSEEDAAVRTAAAARDVEPKP